MDCISISVFIEFILYSVEDDLSHHIFLVNRMMYFIRSHTTYTVFGDHSLFYSVNYVLMD